MKSTKQLFVTLKNLMPLTFANVAQKGLKHPNLSVEKHGIHGNCVRVKMPMPANKKCHTKPKMSLLQAGLADLLLKKGFMISRPEDLPWAVKVWVSNL